MPNDENRAGPSAGRYDFSRTALYHPERRPVFVGLDAGLAFEAENAGFSLPNAWWLANASHLAYYDSDKLSAQLQPVGLRLIDSFDQDGTQAYLAGNTAFAILAFRGTEIDEFKDTLTNINLPLVSFQGTGKVHKGFLHALDRIWDRVEPRLRELTRAETPVWYTGHSLGAALAVLAAARIPPAALFTFGSPRIGNGDFAAGLNTIPHFRFVNSNDIVPTLPPGMLGYAHTGLHLFLSANGKLTRNPGGGRVLLAKIVAAVLYALRLPYFRPGMVKLRALADHTILNYTAGVRRNIATKKKTSAN